MTTIHGKPQRTDIGGELGATVFMFLANRNDGFGQRLIMLLKAIRLSNLVSQDYKFTWHEKKGEHGSYHAAQDIKHVFSESFIKNHFSNEFIPHSIAQVKKSEDLLRFDNTKIYAVYSRKLLPYLDQVNPVYLEELNAVKFSDKVNIAIDLAKSVKLDEKAIAIHLRGGDICFGPLKHKSIMFQDKVVPLSVAKTIITHATSSVVVFTQDEKFKRYLSGVGRVIFSDDLMGSGFEDNIEKTMFDIILMSRCETIVGRDSAIPIVASMISGVKILDPCEDNERVIKSILSDEYYNSETYDSDTLLYLSV